MANKPYLVVEWNDTETDAKGWMCAYNFVIITAEAEQECTPLLPRRK